MFYCISIHGDYQFFLVLFEMHQYDLVNIYNIYFSLLSNFSHKVEIALIKKKLLYHLVCITYKYQNLIPNLHISCIINILSHNS